MFRVKLALKPIIVEKNNGNNIEDTSMHFYIGNEGIIDAQKAMTITQDGYVGIGGNPLIYSRLVVGRTDGNADRMPPCHEAMVIGTKHNAGAGTRAGLYFDTQSRNGGGIVVEKANDLPGNEDHRMRFYVTREGDIDSHNYMTIYETGVTEVQVLRIRGGADLAEPFDVTAPSDSTQIVPGMVMVIDRDRDGKLTPCTQAYDTAVAGILSGAKGHAMKAADAARAPGAVIGKAMTELTSGIGLVLVLVNLQ